MGLYIISGFAFISVMIVLLGFFGPEYSDRPFWKMIHRIRSFYDLISYSLFNIIAFTAIGRALYELIVLEGSDPARTMTKRFLGVIGALATGGILIYSVRRYSGRADSN